MARLRLFLCYAESELILVSQTAERLEKKQVSCFYAARDIPRGDKWQPALTTALSQCDALVAFICGRFRLSEWTDQEVGYALGHDRLVIPVMLDGRTVPHGFLGPDQAITRCSTAEGIATELYGLLWRRDEFRRLLGQSLIETILSIRDHGRADELGFACEQLARLPRLTADHVDGVRAALRDNRLIRADRRLQRHLNELLKREESANE